jgi:hypothetical protein
MNTIHDSMQLASPLALSISDIHEEPPSPNGESLATAIERFNSSRLRRPSLRPDIPSNPGGRQAWRGESAQGIEVDKWSYDWDPNQSTQLSDRLTAFFHSENRCSRVVASMNGFHVLSTPHCSLSSARSL